MDHSASVVFWLFRSQYVSCM